MSGFIIKGIFIGLIFGIPVGVVGAMTAQRTLNYGIKAGLLTGLGSSVADCIYASIGAFGLTVVSDFLLKYERIIHLVGCCIILGMGIRMMSKKNNRTQTTKDIKGGIKMFVSSFLIGITNPVAILTFLFAFSWAGISGKMAIKEGIALVCGVFVGTYLWWGTLSGGVAMLEKRAKNHYLQRVNQLFGIILMLLSVLMLSACGSQEISKENKNEANEIREEKSDSTKIEKEGDTLMQTIIIEVGGQSFPVIVYDNHTVRALTTQFPMTLSMDEMNGNEKYFYLNERLPVDAQNIGNIKTGDILLYGSDCLVLFFEDFKTSYSYTRIGYVEDAEAFAAALSSGTVEVSFRVD